MADEVADGKNTDLSETAQRYDRLRMSIPVVRPPDALVVTGAWPPHFLTTYP